MAGEGLYSSYPATRQVGNSMYVLDPNTGVYNLTGILNPDTGVFESPTGSIADRFNAAFGSGSGLANTNNSFWRNFFHDNKGNFSLGNLGKVFGIGADIASIGLGLYGMKNAKEAMRLAKEQINFQQGLANRNIYNQAMLINNAIGASASTAAASGGATWNNGKLYAVDDATKNSYMQKAKKRYVNGSPIGSNPQDKQVGVS